MSATKQPQERPIILREHEARGLRDGSVSVLWRVMKPQPLLWANVDLGPEWHRFAWHPRQPFGPEAGMPFGTHVFGRSQDSQEALVRICPYGVPGDRLWCRETFVDGFPGGGNRYRADFAPRYDAWERDTRDANGPVIERVESWRSPVAMPRWACRTVVEIVDVRVMRPQEANAREICAAGLMASLGACLGDFAALDMRLQWRERWGDTWTVNPWCWALTVRRLPAALGNDDPAAVQAASFRRINA